MRPDDIVYTFLTDGEKAERELTFAALDQKAKSIAALLQEFGATGERALLLYPFGSELEFITSFFGCLYSAVGQKVLMSKEWSLRS